VTAAASAKASSNGTRKADMYVEPRDRDRAETGICSASGALAIETPPWLKPGRRKDASSESGDHKWRQKERSSPARRPR